MKSSPKYAAASMGPKGQTLEQVHKIVADILGRAGCDRCGRIAFLRVDFVSDPPPDLANANVTSFAEQGLGAG